MRIKNLILFLLIVLQSFALFAQTETASELLHTPQLNQEQIDLHAVDPWYTAKRPDYSEIDERVKTLAKNEASSAGAARIVCEGLESEIEKARAIFDWLCYNIAYDTTYKIYHPDEAFKKRKGVCQGYAELFDVMAKTAGLKTEMITGIGYGVRRDGHAWNVVYLKEGRPLLLDSCWGAGYVNGGRFTKKFDPCYFDTHPVVFAYTHLPAEEKKQFFYPSITKKEFYKLPRIRAEEYLPYGFKDPVNDYYDRFNCDSTKIPAVSLRSSKEVTFQYEYISTGPDLTDGFFIFDHEVMQSDYNRIIENENLKPVLKGTFENNSSPVVNVCLVSVAEYCNTLSRSKDLENCFTVTETGQVFLDLTKNGYRVPTKKEWLLALNQSEYENISKADFAQKVWFYENYADQIHEIATTNQNANKLYDMLGNVNEICWDEETDQFVLMGGCVTDSMENILELKSIPYNENLIEKEGYCGFRTVYSAPENGQAQYNLALSYARGQLVEKDVELYNKWLDLAVAQNNADAIGEKGAVYFNQGGAENRKRGFEFICRAADLNNNNSLMNLGRFYKNGIYVEQDYEKAFYYYEKACSNGYVQAFYELSQFYRYGRATQQNDDKYFKYLNDAYEKGYDSESIYYELGECYKTGCGCEKDEKKAYSLYETVYIKYGTTESILHYADCYAQGIGVRKNFYTAFSYYEEAAEKGNNAAKEKLADLFYMGNGVNRNIKKAIEIYKELSEADSLNENYKIKYELYDSIQFGIEAYGEKGKEFFESVTNGKDICDYLKVAFALTQSTKKLMGGDCVTDLRLLQKRQIEELNKKFIEPLNIISSGEKLKEKTLIVILPKNNTQSCNLEKLIYSSDYFYGKKFKVNGEYYNYDESFFEHYQNIIFFQDIENRANFNEGFEILRNSLADCSEVDFMTFTTDFFTTEEAYMNSFKAIIEDQIEKGRYPRILAIGNKTDTLQQILNPLFNEEESRKINVFGTPANMKGQMACGFRKGNLFIVMLTEKINGRLLLIYLDETGWAPEPTREDKTFAQSSQNLTKMANSGINKGGTITKPGKMVLHYKVVKEKK